MPETTSAAHRQVTRWAGILIFVTVALGAIVCATDSSSACPAWPVCYADRIGPGLRVGWLENPVIEFIHRLISFTALVLLGVSGWLGRGSADRRVRVYPWAALACAIGSAVFGMMIILFTLPLGLGLLDLAFALIAMVLITVTDAASRPAPSTGTTRLRGLIRATLALLIVMHLLGSVVAGTTSDGTGSYTRCLSWPLWGVNDIDRFPALQVLRIVMAVAAIVLIAAIVAVASKRPWLRPAAVTSAVCLAVELALGVVISLAGLAPTRTNGIDATIAVGYSFTAVALLWSMSWLLGLVEGDRLPGETHHVVHDPLVAGHPDRA